MPNGRRVLLFQAVLLVGSLGVGVLLVEAITRFFAFQLLEVSNPLMRFDPELGWLQRSGAALLRINEAGERLPIEGDRLGFRKPPRPYRETGAQSVLVVGDSLTAANQLRFEEGWVALVEKHLSTRHFSLQVINAGVDGFDLVQCYRFARRLWPRFEPRQLVLAVYVGNDLQDYERNAGARVPWATAGPLEWAWDHSYFYHLAVGTAWRLREQQRLRRAARERPTWRLESVPRFDALSPEHQERARRQFAAPDLLPALRGPESAARVRSTERVLDAFLQLASERGAGFTLVVLPTKQQVLPAQRAEWLRLHGLDSEQAELPQRALAAWGRTRNARVVDVAPALSRAPRPEDLFWKVDLHLSPAGHAVVAAEVSAALDTALARPPARLP